MVRPKKIRGTDREITCAHCGKEAQEGYAFQLTVHKAEITPDFFIAYDTDIMDYDSFVCSLECLTQFIKEELYVGRNGE